MAGMMEKIEELIALQEAETEVRKIGAVLEKMPAKLEALEEQKRALQQAVDSGAESAAEWKRHYREQESESQELLNRIAKSKEKLSQVKTNKEYTSSLKEIDELNHQHSALEDAMLECLDRIEEVETQLQRSRREMELQTADLDEAAETLRREIEQTRETEQTLKERAQAISEKIPMELMQVYHRVKRQQPRGVAVAQVTGAVCQGCNMNIPPQLYNEVQRRDRLYFCPNCQRIIFWEPNG